MNHIFQKTSSSLRLMKSFVKESMTYNLKLHFQTDGNGTFEGWLQMYLDEVKENLLLELAVLFCGYSLVTAFLKTKHEVEDAGVIFSFMGNSITGKSPAAALGVSIAGNLPIGDQTLFR